MTQPATEPAAPAADGGQGGQGGQGGGQGDTATLAGLDSRLDRLESLVQQALGRGHAAAERHTEARLDRPQEVEDMVRAELERARKSEAEATARQQGEAEATKHREAVEQRLAKLETRPAPALRTITKAIWGGGE